MLDIDGDNDVDLLGVNKADAVLTSVDGREQIWLNDGEGTFTLERTIPNPEGVVSALCDFEGDGDLDVIGSRQNSQAYTIWYNDGTGDFTAVRMPLPNGAGNDFMLGDLDQDGDADAVLGNGVDHTKQVVINDGTGPLRPQQVFGAGTVSQTLLADVDNDGWFDIITANDPHNSTNPERSGIWLNRDFKSSGAMTTVYVPLTLK